MKTLIVAPHPDDEGLGAGGTLLRYRSENRSVAWLIVTTVTNELGWSTSQVSRREKEILDVKTFFNFEEVFNLGFPTTKLDELPIAVIVQNISAIIESYQPNEILIPHSTDVHTDHQIVHKAIVSCAKWFRHPSITRILSYETLSETNFSTEYNNQFFPNVFVDISNFLDMKLQAMEIYSSEIGDFPFPRSRTAIESLARYRGSSSGFHAAEAFQLLRERS